MARWQVRRSWSPQYRRSTGAATNEPVPFCCTIPRPTSAAPSITAGVIDYGTCEYRGACRRFEHAEHARVTTHTAPGVVRALERLTDVEERHLVLTSTHEAAGTLPLAQQAAAHRRNLARGSPLTHDPLLS